MWLDMKVTMLYLYHLSIVLKRMKNSRDCSDFLSLASNYEIKNRVYLDIEVII